MNTQNHSFLAQLLAKDPSRQIRFPDAPLDEALREFAELQKKLAAPASPETPGAVAAGPATPAPAPAEPSAELSASIASVVTNLWRAKSKLVDSATGEPKEETRRIHRHVEGALETFQQIGVTITEMLNQPYDPGLPVKVLTFQPTAGVERDMVLEVIRPTIIWQGNLLQMGEVIVGIPAEKPSKTE